MTSFVQNGASWKTSERNMGAQVFAHLSLIHVSIPYKTGILTELSGPPLNPSKVFSDPPFWVLSYD